MSARERKDFGPFQLDTGTLVATMTGTGDADLYVRKGARPTAANFDCRPYSGNSLEVCRMEAPGAYYLSVMGYALASTFTLSVNIEAPPQGTSETLAQIERAGSGTSQLESGTLDGAITYEGLRDVAIPDDEAVGARSAVFVSEPFVVHELQVEVDIAHTYIGDLTVTLIGPDGSRATLHEREGDGQNDIRRTYEVTAFDELSARGLWRLLVVDGAARDTGKINRFALILTPEQIGGTFSSRRALDIPDADPTGITSRVTVPVNVVEGDPLVAVDITHPYRGDLKVVLSHGQSQWVLHDRTDGSADDLRANYRLLGFTGSAAGEWVLRIDDNARRDVGRLNSWSVTVEGPEADDHGHVEGPDDDGHGHVEEPDDDGHGHVEEPDDDGHGHVEMSYETIFDPVVARLARGRFGGALQRAYDSVKAFGRTEFAAATCTDSPEAWGLEVSVGGNIGVGYRQGLEFAIEGGGIHMNCLNQVDVAPSAQVEAQVNLIRHFGECHSPGESLEDTLFLEIGAGFEAPVGVTLEAGVAYTFGLSRGLLNRAVPGLLGGVYRSYRGAIADLLAGAPLFDRVEDPERQAALCETLDTLLDDQAAFPNPESVKGAMVGGFLRDYMQRNAQCDPHADHVDDHGDDHGDEDHGDEDHDDEDHDDEDHDDEDHDDEDHEFHSHDHHHGHGADSWSVCSQLTLKSGVGFLRDRLASLGRRDRGVVMQWSTTQLDAYLEFLDNMLSGCDHIEFQLNAGIGVASPATGHIALESHNYYGTLSFDGSDVELGEALGAALDAEPYRAPHVIRWVLDRVCHVGSFQSWYSFLPAGFLCRMTRAVVRTIGQGVATLRALGGDDRFELHLARSLRFYAFNLPLPNNALLNYAVNCSLGPLRNAAEVVWAP